MSGKSIEESFFKYLMAFFTFGLVALLLFIIFEILKKGLRALSWEMVSQVPKGGFYFGKEGGILNAIIGSLILSVGAALISFCLSLPVALLININLIRFKKLQRGFRFVLDLLWGVPPIIYGAFGFAIMLALGFQASLFAGMFTIALLITPVMIRAMDEVTQNIPIGLMEAAYALGATRHETGFKLYVRQALPGIATAFLLAFSKGVGDTAAVLFTAGYSDYIPEKLTDPVATLPLAIFFQLGSPIPEVKARAYAAAVVLTAMILLISLLSRFISSKLSKNIL